MPSEFRVTDYPTFLHLPDRKPFEVGKGVLPITTGSYMSVAVRRTRYVRRGSSSTNTASSTTACTST